MIFAPTPARIVLLALSLTAGSACAESAPGTVIEHRDVPFTGTAYPNRRVPIKVPAAGLGVVADVGSDTLSFVDLGTGQRSAKLPVGRNPVNTDGPDALAIDPPRGALYVALSYPETFGTGPHAAHLSGTLFGYVQKLALDDLRLLGEVSVDAHPTELALSEDRGRIVVSHFNLVDALKQLPDLEAAQGALAVIDPSDLDRSPAPDPVRIPVCVAPEGLALSRPDGALAYVACYGEDTIAVVDLSKPSANISRVPVGPGPGAPGQPSYGPRSATLSPDGATLALGCAVSHEVRFFDVASSTIQGARTIVTTGTPFFPAWSADGARLYVPVQGPDALLVFDVANDNTEAAQRAFAPGECDKPHVVQVESEAAVLLVCAGNGTDAGRVLALDASTLATLSSTEVGIDPHAIARLPAGAP